MRLMCFFFIRTSESPFQSMLGALVDKLDLEGRSPLHIAALSGHTEAVPFLRVTLVG